MPLRWHHCLRSILKFPSVLFSRFVWKLKESLSLFFLKSICCSESIVKMHCLGRVAWEWVNNSKRNHQLDVSNTAIVCITSYNFLLKTSMDKQSHCEHEDASSQFDKLNNLGCILHLTCRFVSTFVTCKRDACNLTSYLFPKLSAHISSFVSSPPLKQVSFENRRRLIPPYGQRPRRCTCIWWRLTVLVSSDQSKWEKLQRCTQPSWPIYVVREVMGSFVKSMQTAIASLRFI